MILNAQTLKDSPVVIAVCSQSYSVDPTGRLKYEREIAYRYGIKIIPIVLPNCSVPSDVFDVEPIEAGNEFLGCDFYKALLRDITHDHP